MEPRKIGVLNVGGNTLDGPNRGPIFADGSFKFLPIPQGMDEDGKQILFRFPTYADLELTSYIKDSEYWNQPVHLDPDFFNMTYGHGIKRGYGCESILTSLQVDDILTFSATLDYKDKSGIRPDWIDPDWGTYLIGSFTIKGIYTQEEFLNLPYFERRQFTNNPHFLKREGEASLWIAGKKESQGLFKKAFPLHDPLNHLQGNSFLKRHFQTSSGKPAGSGGYYRHTLQSTRKSSIIWNKILNFTEK